MTEKEFTPLQTAFVYLATCGFMLSPVVLSIATDDTVAVTSAGTRYFGVTVPALLSEREGMVAFDGSGRFQDVARRGNHIRTSYTRGEDGFVRKRFGAIPRRGIVENSTEPVAEESAEAARVETLYRRACAYIAVSGIKGYDSLKCSN